MPVKRQLIKLLWIVSPAFTRWADSHINENGLTPQRVRVLVPLLENGPMMMSALKDEMGVSATNITALVDALEKDKMVTRKRHATDRRITLIAITPKAEKIMTENCDSFFDRVGALFSDFSNARQEQFVALLWAMREALIARNVLEERDLNHQASCKNKGV